MPRVDKKARQNLTTGRRVSRRENLDRNSLHTLHLLLSEKSVTRTALLLGQSQPAVSETLARLRTMTGDPLLVRSNGRMELTDHARELLQPVERALAELDRITSRNAGFDPSTSERVFRVGTADNLGVRFHAALAARLRSAAPKARLEAYGLTPQFDCFRKLAEGALDVLMGNWPEPPAHLHMGALFDSDLVCLMSESHPNAKTSLTWKAYHRLRHIDITPRMLGEVGPVDYQLLKLGIEREVVVNYPFFNLIPAMVAKTDLVFTATRQFVAPFARSLPVVIRPLPEALPLVHFYQLWHERTNTSPECRWLRAQVRGAADDVQSQ